MKRLLIFGMCAVIVVGAFAQTAKGGTDDPNRVTVASTLDVRAAIDGLAKRTGAKVIADQSVRGRVRALDASVTVEQALETWSRGQTGWAWRKVYLKKGAAMPTTEALGSQVRALVSLETSGLLLKDGANKTSFFVKDAEPKELSADFDTNAIYVLTNTRSAASGLVGTGPNGAITPEDYVGFQQKSLDTFMKMSPQEQQSALEMTVKMWMGMDPQVRGQMMHQGMKMWMGMVQNMTPEQRQEMMNHAAEMWKNMQNPQ